MKGQWIGSYEGTTQGTIVVNVDDRGRYFQGVAHLFEADSRFPHSLAFFRTADKAEQFKSRTYEIQAFDPETHFFNPWNIVKQRFGSDITFSQYADVEGHWNETHLTLTWTTDTGLNNTAALMHSQADQPSELIPIEKTWSTYKEYLATLKDQPFLFRGQRNPWRLRTSFHRRSRADLVRFIREDIPALHRHLSATTRHVFNLNIPDQVGSFYNLIQHHGYPTPLLDWTYTLPTLLRFSRIARCQAKEPQLRCQRTRSESTSLTKKIGERMLLKF